MANKEINELTAASLPLDGTELVHIIQGGNSRKVDVSDLRRPVTAIDPWEFQPIGVPIPVWDHIPGVETPPTDQTYRYILLTAGEDGAGEYNEGVLSSESVTGTVPLVIATAVIADATSPLDGETVSLINTERRFLRAGSSGTVQTDSFQGHIHNIGGSGAASGSFGFTTGSGGSAKSSTPDNDGSNGTPRIANETRGKNIGATYYMRIR